MGTPCNEQRRRYRQWCRRAPLRPKQVQPTAELHAKLPSAMRMLSSVAPRTIAVQTGSVPTDSRPLRRQYRTIHKKNQMRELKQIMPPSADMGRIANIGLRTPPWQYTITP